MKKFDDKIRHLPRPLNEWLAGARLTTDASGSVGILIATKDLGVLCYALPIAVQIMACIRAEKPDVTSFVVVHGDTYKAVTPTHGDAFVSVSSVRRQWKSG